MKKTILIGEVAILLALLGSVILAGPNQMRPITGGYFAAPTISKNLIVPAPATLTVVLPPALGGTVHIRAAERTSIRVRIDLSYASGSASEARRHYDATVTRADYANNSATVSIGSEDGDDGFFESSAARVDLQIDVPNGIALVIKDASAEVSVDGAVRSLEVTAHDAPIRVDGARGNVHLTSEKGDVEMRDVVGSFTIECIGAEVTLENITVIPGDAGAESAATPRAEVICEEGTVEIDRFIGPISINAVSSAVRIMRLQVTGTGGEIRSEKGDVVLDISDFSLRSALAVRVTGAQVLVTVPVDASATYQLKSYDGGDIVIEDIPHQIEKVRENAYIAISGAGDAGLAITAKDGSSITLRSR